MIVFFSIGNIGNVGYTSQANALAKELVKYELWYTSQDSQSKEATKEILDQKVQEIVLEKDGTEEIETKCNDLIKMIEERKNKKITLVSSGSFGLSFFNTFAKKLTDAKLDIDVEYQYTTDRYFGIPKDLEDSLWLKNLYITSVDGINEFNNAFNSCENRPKVLKTYFVQIDPENIKKQSKDFKTENQNVCNEIENFKDLGEGIAFIGGRVQLPDGNWIENNTGTFENTAKYLMGQGVRVFATHGLRSFTASEKDDKNFIINLKPMIAFYKIIENNLGTGESAYIFAQQEVKGKKNEREPILKKITKQKNEITKKDEIIKKDINIKGSSYHYLLCLAAGDKNDNKKLPIYPTIEQTGLPAEAVAVGVDSTKITPLGEKQGWNLSVESNLEAYKYFTEQQADGHTKNLVGSLTPFDAIKKCRQISRLSAI